MQHEPMKRILVALVLVFQSIQTQWAENPAPTGRKVVVMVWDGMRPDFVTEQNTPTLYQMSREGVTFQKHHPVYISSTEVNGAAIATGDYPCHNRVIANREYRPGIDPLKAVAMESRATQRAAGDEYLGAKTIAEILHSKGIPTAVAGTKGVVILQDPSEKRPSPAASDSVNLIAGKTVQAGALDEIVQKQGPFPANVTYPNETQDNWTARALTETLWKNGVPAFSLLWMSDPDFSQHQLAPGSPLALAAIQSNDKRLASVLAALDAKGARADTDVLVVSDHGFSTIRNTVDVQGLLQAAGFKVSSGEFKQAPAPGEILMVGLGGTLLFYIVDHNETTARQLLEFLQQSDFAGVIFSRIKAEGVFTLEQARLNSPEAPDLVVSMHWTSEKNQYGAPGLFDSAAGKSAGKGMHASLGEFDMHNTLIAAGPDFKKGYQDSLPTGNTDLAPSILQILGIAAPAPMDGRVLTEALVNGAAPTEVKTSRLEAKRDLEKGQWSQYLDVSQVGNTLYFNEGNGGKTP